MMKKKNNLKKIRNRILYGTMGIEFYDISSIIKDVGNFEDIIDKKLSHVKKKGNASIYSEYFDCVVEEYMARLTSTLEVKHLNEKNTIENLFRKRASDEIQLKTYLHMLQEEIEQTKEEYIHLKEIYENCSPLSKGILEIQKTEKELEDSKMFEERSKENE